MKQTPDPAGHGFRPSRSIRSSRGFTLVELLVVIGIIAVLISILLPTLGRARESGRKAQCLSNLRQIAMAIISYAQERKSLPGPANIGIADPETVNSPTTPFTAGEKRQQLSDSELLQPYLRNNRGVWFCPSSIDQRERAISLSNNKLYNWCYKINNQPDTREPFFFGSWTSSRTTYEKQPKKLSLVRSAVNQYSAANTRPPVRSHSEIWMISDIDGRNFTKAHTATFGITDDAVDPELRPWQPAHKAGRVGRNYAFFDGHAEWLGFDFWPVNP